MYYIQLWSATHLYDPKYSRTVANHHNKEIAQLLMQCALEMEEDIQGRVISETALKREGTKNFQAAQGQLESYDYIQEQLWQNLRTMSRLNPLDSVRRAVKDFEALRIRAEDEIHQQVIAGHSFRSIGEAAELSHERVRQIFKEADERLKKFKAACDNGHTWTAYKYHHGILPEDCPVCKNEFVTVQDPEAAREDTHQFTHMIPIQDIQENENGDSAWVIDRDGKMIKILRVYPVEFEMRSQDEQEDILATWAEMLDTLKETPFGLQVITHNRKLNANDYMKQFEERAEKHKHNEMLYKMIRQHIEHMQKNPQASYISREMYLVIKINDVRDATQRLDDTGRIQKIAMDTFMPWQKLMFYLEKMGLQVEDLTREQILQIMKRLLGGDQ